MRYRFVEYEGNIYIVIGQGYDSKFDPPEIFIGVPLADTMIRSILTPFSEIKIPIFQATEITDKKRMRSLLVLYGG